MKKRVLTILLCGVIILGITGCGSKEENQKFNDDTNVNNSSDNSNNNNDNMGNTKSNTLTCTGKVSIYDDEAEHTMIVTFDKNNIILDFKAIFEIGEEIETSISDLKEAFCEDDGEAVKSCDISNKNDKTMITVTYDLDLLNEMTDGEFKKPLTKQQMKDWLLSIPYGENHTCK